MGRNDVELRWIKIRPQHPMPTDGECVLIGHSGEGHVGEARFNLEADGMGWFGPTDEETRQSKIAVPAPTHWMPLPRPPKEYEDPNDKRQRGL